MGFPVSGFSFRPEVHNAFYNNWIMSLSWLKILDGFLLLLDQPKLMKRDLQITKQDMMLMMQGSCFLRLILSLNKTWSVLPRHVHTISLSLSPLPAHFSPGDPCGFISDLFGSKQAPGWCRYSVFSMYFVYLPGNNGTGMPCLLSVSPTLEGDVFLNENTS